MDHNLLANLVGATIIGLIPAYIAHRKGHSFFLYWFVGALLWIVFIPFTLLMKRNPDKFKKCSACHEWIDRPATVCKYCQTVTPTVRATVVETV